MCGTRHAVATKEVHRKKNMVLKSMQESISKIVTRLTKSGVGIRTD